MLGCAVLWCVVLCCAADFFDCAPIFTIPGRMYPVDIYYTKVTPSCLVMSCVSCDVMSCGVCSDVYVMSCGVTSCHVMSRAGSRGRLLGRVCGDDPSDSRHAAQRGRVGIPYGARGDRVVSGNSPAANSQSRHQGLSLPLSPSLSLPPSLSLSLSLSLSPPVSVLLTLSPPPLRPTSL